MVSFSNVSKRYGDQVVLSGVSFTIAPGEFVFLVGKSGSGKTTIMRLLTKQTSHDEGEIVVHDLNLRTMKKKDIPKLRRHVGVIYQDYKLLQERTVAENIALGLEIMGKSSQEIVSRTNDLLGLIGLPEKALLFPGQLSGGEAQRVCIARALATAPRILFADEPTGNLDDQTAYSILRLLSKINELGTTVVMATHNMMLVDRLQKRVLHMKEGRVEDKDGVATTKIEEPQTEKKKNHSHGKSKRQESDGDEQSLQETSTS